MTTEALSRSATRRAAEAATREASGLLRFVIGVEALFGVLILIAPEWSLGQLGLQAGDPARVAGAVLIALALLQFPTTRSPEHGRLSVLVGVAGRLLIGATAVLVGEGLLWVGVLELLFAAAVYWSLRKMVIAILSSRP